MKWIALLVAFCSILPLSRWIRGNPARGRQIWVVFGILLFATDPLHLFMALVSWAYWPGFVKGFEITLLDVLAAAIYLSLRRSKSIVPFRILAGGYLAAVVLSTLQASVPEATLFYAWQLLRMFFVASVTAKACADDERVALSLLKGMVIGVCLEFCFAVWQRFALGEIQAGGTFGHQNSLGMATHFVVFPLFVLLLAGKRGWEPVLGSVAGISIALLTASRAALGLSLFGYILTFVISGAKNWTSRKAIFAMLSVAMIAVLVPLAISNLDKRFSMNPISDEYDERVAFENAASAMLSDHPMGVGANNYVIVANTQGYNQRAGVASTQGSLSAHVHQVYRLVAAETGYLGLVSFILLLLHPLVVAYRWGWRAKDEVTGDLLLGLGTSLLVIYIHSLFEWVLVEYSLQYFLAVNIGVIGGLAQQAGYLRNGLTSNSHIKLISKRLNS